jgi:hypothetical protein
MRLLLIAALVALQQVTGSVVAVTIDAEVVDANGRPVTGLAASDFTVQLDGQPRRVVAATYFPNGAPMAGGVGPTFDAVTAAPPVYRLVVQPPDGAPAAGEFAVAVTVSRPAVKVHAPPRAAAAPVTLTGTRATPAPSAPKSAEERLRDALAAGRTEPGIPIRVAHALTSRGDPAKITLYLRVQFGGATPVNTLLGVVDGRGHVNTGRVPIQSDGDGHRVDVTIGLDPGPHKIRFAVADETGTLGAIEFAVDAQLHRLGPFLASDLIRWTTDPADGPTVSFDDIAASASETRVSLELYPTAGATPPSDVLVKMEFAGIERIVTPEARDGLLAADAVFPLERVGSGSHELRATVMSGTSVLGTVTRTLIRR